MNIKVELNTIYRLFHKYQKHDVCYDAFTTEVDDKYVKFLVSNVFLDNMENKFTDYMNSDKYMILMRDDFNLFNAEIVTKTNCKKTGHCPVCGLKGEFIGPALTCRRHWAYAGI